MPLVNLKPQHVYFPISRVNDEDRTIEAYAFVNEVVDGEGGVRLKRTAMEAATPNYMEWANIRRMHLADPVGIAKSVTWDDKGARMVLEVVDNDAWEKVQRGVYKGLSVGVAATIMRGKDVEACKWFETSLVDRPKDPDAKWPVIRAEGVGETQQEFECDVEEIQRGDGPPDFAALMGANALWEEGYEALDALYSVLCQIALSDAADKPALVSASVKQFEDYIVGLVEGGKVKARAAMPDLTRVAELETQSAELISRAEGLATENQQLLTRAQTAESDLVTVRTELTTAKERVTTLENTPASKPPVRYFRGVDQTFLAGATADPAAGNLVAEFKRLQAEPGATEDERQASVTRMQIIRMELAGQGVTHF